MYHISESVYAAIASSRSSVQPRFGFEYGPHSTTARGLAVRDSDAYALDAIWSYAAFHGWAFAVTRPRTKSSCDRLTSTPGWAKVGGAAEAAGGIDWPTTRSRRARNTIRKRLPDMSSSVCGLDHNGQ